VINENSKSFKNNISEEKESNLLSSSSNYVMEPFKENNKENILPNLLLPEEQKTNDLKLVDRFKEKENVTVQGSQNFKEAQIELSDCLDKLTLHKDLIEETFYNNLISKERFEIDPWKFLNNSNVVIRYNDSIYPVIAAIPLIISILAFNQEPSEEVMKSLLKNQEGGGFFNFFRSKKTDKEIIKIDRKKKSAKSFSSDNNANSGNVSPLKTTDEIIKTHILKEENENGLNIQNPPAPVILERKISVLKPKRTKTPSSDILKRLNLREGRNTISFTVSSRFQGEHTISSEIYLWNYDSKIIISDVDGTITRSDILGHILPMFGNDWSQNGVAELFSNIEKNGYKFLYLTARALCQSYTTQQYLKTLKQSKKRNNRQNEIYLPNGPILMSSDGLVSSFTREVLDKKPEVKLLNNSYNDSFTI